MEIVLFSLYFFIFFYFIFLGMHDYAKKFDGDGVPVSVIVTEIVTEIVVMSIANFELSLNLPASKSVQNF